MYSAPRNVTQNLSSFLWARVKEAKSLQCSRENHEYQNFRKFGLRGSDVALFYRNLVIRRITFLTFTYFRPWILCSREKNTVFDFERN